MQFFVPGVDVLYVHTAKDKIIYKAECKRRNEVIIFRTLISHNVIIFIYSMIHHNKQILIFEEYAKKVAIRKCLFFANKCEEVSI